MVLSPMNNCQCLPFAISTFTLFIDHCISCNPEKQGFAPGRWCVSSQKTCEALLQDVRCQIVVTGHTHEIRKQAVLVFAIKMIEDLHLEHNNVSAVKRLQKKEARFTANLTSFFGMGDMNL